MNKIDFDSLFDNEKKKKKEAKKQFKANKKLKSLNFTTNIDNETSQLKDITDIGYESSGIKNKLDLSNFSEEKETKMPISIGNKLSSDNENIKKKESFFCPHPNCSIQFAYEQSLKEHILKKHTSKKLDSSVEQKKEKSKLDSVVKKTQIICEYCGCSLNVSSQTKHLKKCPEKKNSSKKKKKNKFPCLSEGCNKSFSSDIALTQHFKDVHKRKKSNQSSTIKASSSNNMSSSKVNSLKSNKIRCNYCKKSYSQSDYSSHLNSCIKKFKEVRVLKKTVESLEVQCQYCNKLIHKDYVDKHHKICSEINCEYCGEKLKKDNYQQHLQKCSEYKEFVWEKSSSIQEIKEESTTLTNIEKHQAIKYQFREDEELDPDLIDEEAYQKTFGIQLDDKSQQIRARVAFEHEKIYKQEEEDKSEIKIFLTKMYKGYCQVCGYTFKKTNGVNSFERFNWNDKRVVKVKKSLVSTADSLCLCRNCSANIKWGAFYPNFVDTIKEIEEFKSKSYDEIREILHKVVDKNIPNIFEPLLEFDDIYALEIELDGKPRNIYFTNEHLLQFVTYLQKEDEVEEEVIEKKRAKEQRSRISSLSSGIYSSHVWLKREETIPLSVAQDFVRNSAWWLTHPSGAVRAKKHAYNVYKNDIHGWAIDFGANKFLVGKAIERCKDEINKYIEEFTNGEKSIELDSLKAKLKKHISGAVATYNNGEYSGYYPIDGNDLTFGSQAIDVKDGANFLIRELGLDGFLDI